MDFYIVLGVDRAARLDEIKRAYKRLARRFHPDINPGDRTAAHRFRQIAEAYETLSDPDRRRHYDTAGRSPSSDTTTFGFDGFDFSVSVGGPSASTFGDLFADVLHRRDQSRSGGPERGPDLHHAISLSFDDAMRGDPQEITITRQQHCPTCRGLGR